MGNSNSQPDEAKNQIQVRSSNYIAVKNYLERFMKDENAEQIKTAFDQMQDNQVISSLQFRQHVIGSQIPRGLSDRIYQIFATQEQNTGKKTQKSATPGESSGQKDLNQQKSRLMTFDDLVRFYISFKHLEDNEIGQISFELMKINPYREDLTRDDIVNFCKKAHMSEIYVNDFYKLTKLDTEDTISKQQYMAVFDEIKNLRFIKFIKELPQGYQDEYINFEDNTLNKELMRQIIEIQEQQTLRNAKDLEFSEKEKQNLKNFYEEEIQNMDSEHVHYIFQKIFSDIKSEKLRNRILTTINSQKTIEFETFSTMVKQLVKTNREKGKLSFLFDMFSGYQKEISTQQLKEFIEIFSLSQTHYGTSKKMLNREEFTEKTKQCSLSFKLYEIAKFRLIGMIGLDTLTKSDERQAILAVLDYNKNIEQAIHKQLDLKNSKFYMLEKEFWDSWADNVNFKGDKSIFAIKKAKKSQIDNAKLIEEGHQFRLKEGFNYYEQFIIVPKYVFKSLSSWYTCDKIITRDVNQKQLKQQKQQLNKNDDVNQSAADYFFRKIVGNVEYELEIMPKLIYFELVTDDGQRPNQKAVQNNKIDMNYVKKVLKTDKIPFNELQLTKTTTFKTLKENIIQILQSEQTEKEEENKINYSAKNSRLLIEDVVIEGNKLKETIESFGISIGQLVHIEFFDDKEKTWPSDKSKTDILKLDQENQFVKSQGLYNLGNTCYMNSAIQCLFNLRHFYIYFVRHQKHMKQVNINNPLGYKGKLAEIFGELIKLVWEDEEIVEPKNFKDAVGEMNEMFSGDQQQDTQEFISFLIDGLHEDLNLRKSKPYIENPESDNRNITDLSFESYSNSLRRDWSFISFLFNGQTQSNLDCQVCRKLSITFEILSSIPLSLPEPKEFSINIIVHPLPSSLRRLLELDDGQLEYNSRQRQNRKRQNIQKSGGKQSDDGVMLSDKPLHIFLKIDKKASVQDLLDQITAIPEVGYQNDQEKTILVLYQMFQGVIRGVFDNENKLSQYKMSSNEIHAQEVITTRGRELLHQQFTQKLNNESNNSLQLLQFLKARKLFQIDESSISLDISNQMAGAGADLKRQIKMISMRKQQESQHSKTYLFNNFFAACDRYEDIERKGQFPDDIFVVVYHRIFANSTTKMFHDLQPQLIASPILLVLPIEITGFRLYEEIWASSHTLLDSKSRFLKRENIWWVKDEKEWRNDLKKFKETKKGVKPFILKTVDRQGYSCSQCPWVKKCSGCIVEPDDKRIHEFFKKSHIAIEWHSQMIENDYNQSSLDIQKHKSVNDKDDEDFSRSITLDDCLANFHKVEKLMDTVFCSQCEEQTPHTKQFKVSRPPPILVIQLKRFKNVDGQWRKLQTYVDFPLYDFDLSQHVYNFELLTKLDFSTKYDLTGFIDHYGTLTFGHYVSTVKNPFDGKWYRYDDQNRVGFSENRLFKENAYILFYQRKDVKNKSLNDLFPGIQEIFPGKPVSTTDGQQGYVLGMKPQTTKNVQVIDFENADFYIKSDEVIIDRKKSQIARDTELIDDGDLDDSILLDKEDDDSDNGGSRKMSSVDGSRRQQNGWLMSCLLCCFQHRGFQRQQQTYSTSMDDYDEKILRMMNDDFKFEID